MSELPHVSYQPMSQPASSKPADSAAPPQHPHESAPPPAPVEPTGASARQWVSPGVSPVKRLVTGIGVALSAALLFFLAAWQGASMLVSTIIGVVFLGGFVYYLWVVAPAPFTLTVDPGGIARADRAGVPVEIAWANVAKIKEERFKSGRSVSLTVYKRVGERGLHRAFVVYRDDVPDFDGLLSAVRASVPDERPWFVETVHE